MSDSSNNILQTIAYFDLFNYPLTSWELWRLADTKKNYGEFLAELDNDPSLSPSPYQGEGCLSAVALAKEEGGVFPLLRGRVTRKDGFYCLSGRAGTVAERQVRYNISDRKFKRALKAAWWFSRLPWIKLVCLANQIGAHNLRVEGDIDFFIVTKANRLWLSRLLLAGTLKILNLRPRAGKSQDTFCLSFWISENHLDLKKFRLNNQKNTPPPCLAGRQADLPLDKGEEDKEQDLYFTYWLASLTPLFDAGNNYQNLLANNPWLQAILPNWQAMAAHPRRSLPNRRPRHGAGYAWLDRWENLARDWQIKRLPPELKNIANLDSRVVVNAQVAKLHAKDGRKEFYNRYLQLIKNL